MVNVLVTLETTTGGFLDKRQAIAKTESRAEAIAKQFISTLSRNVKDGDIIRITIEDSGT